MYKIIMSILYCFLFFLGSCQNGNIDPDLETADSNGHGHNLTALGSLLNYPWEYSSEFDSCKFFLYKNEQKVKYGAVPLTESEKGFVFELRKDRTLRYWSKKDYLKSPYDTITQLDGIKSVGKHHYRSDDIQFKTKYSIGNWAVNFKDSSIRLNFGDGAVYSSIGAKIYLLDPSEMILIQTSSFDSTENARKIHYKKEVVRYFTH